MSIHLGEIESQEAFQSYTRGYRAGVGAKAKDPKFSEHMKRHIRNFYTEGYETGRIDANRRITRVAKDLGLDLRTMILREDAREKAGRER